MPPSVHSSSINHGNDTLGLFVPSRAERCECIRYQLRGVYWACQQRGDRAAGRQTARYPVSRTSPSASRIGGRRLN